MATLSTPRARHLVARRQGLAEYRLRRRRAGTSSGELSIQKLTGPRGIAGGYQLATARRQSRGAKAVTDTGTHLAIRGFVSIRTDGTRMRRRGRGGAMKDDNNRVEVASADNHEAKHPFV